ncbi:MAG: hypothetical protein ACO3EZ_12360 [Prochlorotrichaceae cyanobacterium]
MAINWETLKEYYLQANRTSQLDSLVLNLRRLQVLAKSEHHDRTNESIAEHLVRETQFFIEWLVPVINLETDLNFATELVDLQRLLSQWKLNWSALWKNESDRQEIAFLAQHWSDRLAPVGTI